jgi:hypothetical protein
LGTGKGRRTTALTALKIAVVAPMPNASVATAISVNPKPRAHQLAGSHFEMEVEFVVDFFVDAGPPEPQRKTRSKIHCWLDGQQHL